MIRDNAHLGWLVRQGERAATGLAGQTFVVRERAASFQEAALGALNLPTAAAIERLTRRVVAVSRRLETIEDELAELPGQLRALPPGPELAGVAEELAAIRQRLDETTAVPSRTSG